MAMKTFDDEEILDRLNRIRDDSHWPHSAGSCPQSCSLLQELIDEIQATESPRWGRVRTRRITWEGVCRNPKYLDDAETAEDPTDDLIAAQLSQAGNGTPVTIMFVIAE